MTFGVTISHSSVLAVSSPAMAQRPRQHAHGREQTRALIYPGTMAPDRIYDMMEMTGVHRD